jgi:RHS repeat-associated protein
MSRRTLLQHSLSHIHVIQLPIVGENRYWSSLHSFRKAKHPQAAASGANAWRLLLCAWVVFIFSARVAIAQVNTGTPSFSAYDSGEYDTINLQNLSVSLHVPVMSKSGAFPFTFSLVGGGSYIYASGSVLVPGIEYSDLVGVVNGVLANPPTGVVAGSVITGVPCPSGHGSGTATMSSQISIVMPDRTQHPLPVNDTIYSGPTCFSGFTDQTIDGSGFTFSETSSTTSSIYTNGGLALTSNSIKDSQSAPNSVSMSTTLSGTTFTDTMGNSVLTSSIVNGSPWVWTDVNGGSPQVAASYTGYPLRTTFGCTGFTDTDTEPNSLDIPTTITFPDTTTLGIAFEQTPGHSSDRTGRVSQLTMRDGSSHVSFNYNPSAGSNDGLNCTYLVPNGLTRTTSDGTVTYSLVTSLVTGAHYKSVTTKIDIGGNKTTYTFTGLTGAGVAALPVTQALTQKAYYANGGTVSVPSYSGTPTRTETYCYNGNASSCATTNVNLPITEIDVYVNDNVSTGTSRTQTQYDGGPSGSCGSGTGGCYGNVTSVSRYDYGASSPTFVTTTTYGGCGAGSTVNDKPCEIKTIYAGNTASDNKYTYSSYGNLLKVSLSTDGGSTFIGNTTSNLYNSNGTPSKTYDVANNETDYSYSTANYSDGCSGSNYAVFPTNIKNLGTGVNASATYDCTGGVKLHDVDASGNVTIYGYQSSGGAADPWWRVMSVTDPLGNETWKTYFQSGPIGPYTESASSFGTSVDNEWRTTDGYGRPVLFQKAQSSGGSNYDTVSTSYNFSGVNPTVFTSIPCSAASTASCPKGSTTTLDMFGRPLTIVDGGGGTDTISYSQNDVLTTLSPAPSGENNKSVQNEYDGFGRLTESCFISATASGNVSCGEHTGSSSGIATYTSYGSSPGGQQWTSSSRGGGTQHRTRTVDSLGRLIATATPEAGETDYYYDYTSGSPCGGTYNFPGKLVRKKYPNGNFECYDYDALGRLLDVSAGYSGGGTTACRRFRYDNTTGVLGSLPTGVTLSNTSGRLAEAETDNCVQPVIATLTDEWFSYNVDGQLTDYWESTPNSGTYYHSTATYSGPALLTTQLVNPSFYTATHTLDGEGRWYSFTTGTSVSNKVSGTTYTAAQQPSTISLYSSDGDSYTYDTSAARMTGWTFQLNSVQETGIVDWNPNGTLKDIQIADGFNAGGSQNCDFNNGRTAGTGYDDLARLIGTSCGTSGATWNQAFSYDQYDNLTKSSTGYVIWNPTYSASTNHYACTACTYDSSGNVTYDGTNSYQWNEFNKMKSVNGSGTNCSTGGDCNTYDAFGRLVETDPHGGSKLEIWYAQGGKIFMNGSSALYAYWPTGGGAKQIVTGNNGGVYFVHKDWLGNGRIVSTGRTVQSDMAYAPYGEVYDIFGSTAPKYQGFNGDSTQDVFAGMYETQYRQLQGSQQGRWLSPDPAGSGWNQYAYSTNPNIQIDPSGLEDDFDNEFLAMMGFGFSGGYGYSEGSYMGQIGAAPINGYNNGNGYINYTMPVVTSADISTFPGLSVLPVGGAAPDPVFADATLDPNNPGRIISSVCAYCVQLLQLLSPTTNFDPITLSPSPGGIIVPANNGTPTTPVIQQVNGKFKPNVPPEWGFCGKYRDGSGGGSALYQICMNTPNSPWGNCVRGTLLNQYTPNPNPPELFVYLFVDHPVDFASCLGK